MKKRERDKIQAETATEYVQDQSNGLEEEEGVGNGCQESGTLTSLQEVDEGVVKEGKNHPRFLCRVLCKI